MNDDLSDKSHRCDTPLTGKYVTVQRLIESGTAEFHIAEIDFKFIYTDYRKFRTIGCVSPPWEFHATSLQLTLCT